MGLTMDPMMFRRTERHAVVGQAGPLASAKRCRARVRSDT